MFAIELSMEKGMENFSVIPAICKCIWLYHREDPFSMASVHDLTKIPQPTRGEGETHICSFSSLEALA